METKQVFEKIRAFADAAGATGFTTSGEVKIYKGLGVYFSVKVGDCEIETASDGVALTVKMPLGTDYASTIEATTTAMELYLKSVTDALNQ